MLNRIVVLLFILVLGGCGFGSQESSGSAGIHLDYKMKLFESDEVDVIYPARLERDSFGQYVHADEVLLPQ